MRAAPALAVRIGPSPLSRRALAVTVAAAAAVCALWLGERFSPNTALRWGCVAAAGLLGAWIGARSARREALDLAWDGRAWTLARPPAAPREGQLALALDLGTWWLLRFRPLEAPRRDAWIAVERRDLEAEWHALRCALHSPSPASHDDRARA